MPTYLYCLVTSAEPAPSLRGIDAQPVRAVKAGRAPAAFTAWVSDIEARRVPPTVERARAHNAVVRGALRHETPLPARFGQIFADDAALESSLASRGEALSRVLERIRGGVEMTVRIPVLTDEPDDQGAPRTGTGREYLERLRHRDRLADETRGRAEFLHRRIALAAKDLIRESSPPSYTPSAGDVTLSHLIAREAVPSYRHVLHGILESEVSLHASVSGPWAPYSFAELSHD